jgi:cytochrome bd ubiquinol oxidase subunit II
MSNAAAVILMLAIITYAVFGGADFGAGFWDLIAGNAQRGARPREQIAHSIGPVWEANHVWLIFTLVVLWTCFPTAFEAIMVTLFIPLTLAALGIVLRGAGFAFRKSVVRLHYQRDFGALFALSSVLVPYCFGAVAGSIASGHVPVGGISGDPWNSWFNPTSIVMGLLAVSMCAFLAATFLVWDSRRSESTDLEQYFRIRAVASAAVCGVLAVVASFVLDEHAGYVFHGLTSRGLPLVILSALCGTSALVLLHVGAPKYGRILAVGAVASVVAGWGVAQWPYLLPTSLTVSQAAAPSGTLGSLLIVFAAAAVLVIPSIGLLYVLDQKSLLQGEGATETG